MNRRKQYLRAALLITSFLLSGCLEFESIEQPSSVRPGERFTVSMAVAVDYNDTGYSPHFAVRLPDGWTIPGDSLACTGIYNAEIVFDPDLALSEEKRSPSPEGYHWWAGAGDGVQGSLHGTAYATISIQTDEQTGLFFLDYTLGNDDGGVEDRSHGHRIEVVDEYTPRELQAAVEGNAVSLSWSAPSAIEGFLGYHLYRDGQLLNTESLADTGYHDTDLPGNVFHYSVSSLYENGDEHVTPYEIKALVFSGGTGEPDTPYQIALPEQLIAIADFPALLDQHFVLNNNIDLNPNLPGARVFNRAVTPAFSGTFDGQGHEIRHLTIAEGERTNGRLGLFGTLEFGGQVRNLGLTDVRITSSGPYVAGLAGQNNGELNSCYVTGEITGGSGVGGLVGKNDPNGQIGYCYSSGFVSNGASVGGLAGINEGSIVSSYSTSSVSGGSGVGGLVGRSKGSVFSSYSTGMVSGTYDVGGLVGYNEGHVNASFWDIQSSRQSGSNGGAALTTAEMMDPFQVGLMGLANDPNWVLDAGRDYPRLAWEGTPGAIVPAVDLSWLTGQGTAESPYLIETADQLILLGKADILRDRHFLLGADIDLDPALPGRQIFRQAAIPVLAGVFDGAGHVISNLTIEGAYNLGLFGALTNDAEVSNLGIVNVQVSVTAPSAGAGGLVGTSHGRIVSSYSSGTITTSPGTDIDMVWSVGGLVGDNYGKVLTSFSAVTISGSFEGVGGLVGWNGEDGSIEACYSTGSVAATGPFGHRAGGLVGWNRGSITTCYSNGSVSGESSLGGLVGENEGSFDASFWNVQSSGQIASAGGNGMTTSAMWMAETFLAAGWDFIGETANGAEEIWWIDEGVDYPKLWWELSSEN